MPLWSNTDLEASKPKYLNTADKAATVGVTIVEAQNATNIAKGINTPGWVKTSTYTDAQGNVRNKNEVLVAFGSMTGDSDSLPPVPTITITGQPAGATVFSGATATFTATATITNSATLSYQWQKQESGAGAWANIGGATSASYTTGALTVAADNTDAYRVVVSGTLGAASVNSTAATLTVNPSVITIDTQPTSQSVTEPGTATFTVVASATGGATLSYQWEKLEAGGGSWGTIVGATSTSYTTAATTVGDDDGDQYRVVVSANKEAAPVTSSAATLTVTV